MNIYRRGDGESLYAWPFMREIDCGNCHAGYNLEPGVDARAFDVAQIPVENAPQQLALLNGTMRQSQMKVVAIVLCPVCGYPNALDRPEETNDVAGTGEDSDSPSQHGG